MTAPTRRIAVVQAGATLFDTPATLDRMAAHVDTLRAEQVELAVFPEAYVGGYPKGLDFGARVGSRTPAGRDDFARYWQSAIEVPGPEVARMAEMAASANATLVVGVIERAGGTLYCAALTIGPDGTLLARHRKLMPTASERLIWGQGDGSTLQLADTPVGKVAAAICWENYMPALRQHYHAGGVEYYCAPTVDDRDIWQTTMRHIAYEGRCFVLSACQYMTRADAPADYDCIQGNDPATVLIRGGSVIVGPMGDVHAGPVYGAEAALVADIDPVDIVRGRYDLDVSGHYARPDVFTLTVDTRAKTPVMLPTVDLGED